MRPRSSSGSAVQPHIKACTGPPPTSTLALPGLLPLLLLLQEDALAVLRKHVGGRDVLLEEVYNYWRAKRERLGKPILRRLQAPTNPSDTNPFNVFRSVAWPRPPAGLPACLRAWLAKGAYGV